MSSRPQSGMADGFMSRLTFAAGERDDPVDWVEGRLGEHVWSGQAEILRALVDHPRVAVQAANAVGKSHIAARAGAWWIDQHPVRDVFLGTVAPTQTQIAAILWRYLRRVHADAELPGRITQGVVPEWKVGDALVGYGRKSADMVNAEEAAAAFQGIHATYLLWIIDEAAGVQPWLWEAIESMAISEQSRVLAIGNPTDPASHFAKVCAPGSGWHVLKVSAFDTPAFTGEDAPAEVVEQLANRASVERMRKTWGEGSARWQARVLGEFPDEADDALISAAWIRAAQKRTLPRSGRGSLGVDIARSGDDRTVAYSNFGGVVRRVHRAQGDDLMTTTGVVVRLTRELVNAGRVTVVVDADGVGAGVFDRLREQFGGGGGAIVFPDGRGSLVGGGSGAEVVGFRASERAWRPDRFINRRAEMWWTLREAFRDGLIDIDAADEDLAAQLVAMRFTEDSKGRIQIESKADMKKRGLRSPDDADAVAMSLVGGHWRPVAVDRERDLLDRAEGMRVARLEARRGAVPARCLPPADEILGFDELMSRPM